MFFTYTINLLKRNFHNSNKHNLTIKLTDWGKKIGKNLSAIYLFFLVCKFFLPYMFQV